MDLNERQKRIEQLRKKIAACTRCDLHKTRTNTVPGEGSLAARIMFIGEAPGNNEDLQGKPFVGRAGNVLDVLLKSVGLIRDDIYICNILKCRPPGNRNPLATEIHACVGSLDLQIKIINPSIIATLGNFATTYIFEKFGIPPAKIGSVAGKMIEVETPFGPKKIVPLFHPAVATYNVHKTDDLIRDFQIFRKLLNEEQVQKEKKSTVPEITDTDNIEIKEPFPNAPSQLEFFE